MTTKCFIVPSKVFASALSICFIWFCFESDFCVVYFEKLPFADRVLFLSTAGILLWGISRLFNARHLDTGVAHVINRLHHHQGRLPFKNTLYQFVGSVISLVGGFSVGREGPAVHLGAWCSSAISQWMKLPNNCTRTLIGCGTAAAISASFNTPLAGAIFAMEVIMMEYTVISAVPVILAAVIGWVTMYPFTPLSVWKGDGSINRFIRSGTWCLGTFPVALSLWTITLWRIWKITSGESVLVEGSILNGS